MSTQTNVDMFFSPPPPPPAAVPHLPELEIRGAARRRAARGARRCGETKRKKPIPTPLPAPSRLPPLGNPPLAPQPQRCPGSRALYPGGKVGCERPGRWRVWAGRRAGGGCGGEPRLGSFLPALRAAAPRVPGGAARFPAPPRFRSASLRFAPPRQSPAPAGPRAPRPHRAGPRGQPPRADVRTAPTPPRN